MFAVKSALLQTIAQMTIFKCYVSAARLFGILRHLFHHLRYLLLGWSAFEFKKVYFPNAILGIVRKLRLACSGKAQTHFNTTLGVKVEV